MDIHISSNRISRNGEQLVCQALEGSKWAEGYLGLEWNDIKIVVYTSTVNRGGKGFVFSNRNGFDKDRLKVFVGIDKTSGKDESYFWIKETMDTKGFYGAIVDSVKQEELGDKIKELYK